jgi:hypothetical protein
VGFEATGGLDALKERQKRMSERVAKAKTDLEEASKHPAAERARTRRRRRPTT